MARRVAFFTAAFLLVAAPAAAHHPGSASNTGAAGGILTISPTTLEPEHGAIAVLYEFIRFGGIGDADLIKAASKHIHAHSIQSIASPALSVAYGVVENFTVFLRLPWVQRNDIREGHHEHVMGVAINSVDQRGDTSGLGDLTLLGQFRFLNNRATGTEMALLFGAKLPTGRTNAIDRMGELFEAEFQPGSGSWDWLLGFAAGQRFGQWSLTGNVLYVLAGTGTQQTNLGNRLLYNAAISYRLLGYMPAPLTSPLMSHSAHEHKKSPIHVHEPAPTPDWIVDGVLEFNGEWHDYTRVAGVRDANSGGNVIYLSPGLRVARAPVAAFATFGIPIVNQVNGIQSKSRYRLFAGIGFAF